MGLGANVHPGAHGGGFSWQMTNALTDVAIGTFDRGLSKLDGAQRL